MIAIIVIRKWAHISNEDASLLRGGEIWPPSWPLTAISHFKDQVGSAGEPELLLLLEMEGSVQLIYHIPVVFIPIAEVLCFAYITFLKNQLRLENEDILIWTYHHFLLKILQIWPHPLGFQVAKLLPTFAGSAQSPHHSPGLRVLDGKTLKQDTWALKECFMQQQEDRQKNTKGNVPVQVLFMNLIVLSLNTLHFPWWEGTWVAQ